MKRLRKLAKSNEEIIKDYIVSHAKELNYNWETGYGDGIPEHDISGTFSIDGVEAGEYSIYFDEESKEGNDLFRNGYETAFNFNDHDIICRYFVFMNGDRIDGEDEELIDFCLKLDGTVLDGYESNEEEYSNYKKLKYIYDNHKDLFTSNWQKFMDFDNKDNWISWAASMEFYVEVTVK